MTSFSFLDNIEKLEDLKVLRRSPDLFNNVKIGQGFTTYNKTYFVLPYMGVAAILVKWPKQSYEYSIKQLSDSWETIYRLDRYVAVQMSSIG